MKLKPVATASMPPAFLAALDSTEVDDAFRQKLAVENLHVNPDDLGPATHYVQNADYSLPPRNGEWGVEVTLSKVSVNESRSSDDFKRAMAATEDLYKGLIEEHLYTDQRAQLFVVLALDRPVMMHGTMESLPERKPIWVTGMIARVKAPGLSSHVSDDPQGCGSA